MPPPRFDLWDFSRPVQARVGRFPTRRLAHRMALRLGLRAYQVRPAARRRSRAPPPPQQEQG